MQIVANGEPLTIEEGRRFTVLVHQQGIRVDVPEAVEINSRNTIDCMEKMTERAWKHISTGELFRMLFAAVFPKEDYGGETDTRVTVQLQPENDSDPYPKTLVIDMESGLPIPESVAELNKQDFGVIHVCGMIVLGCEAIFSGKTKIFFRNPENHLHPKTERRIVDMFMKMLYLANAGGGTVVGEQ